MPDVQLISFPSPEVYSRKNTQQAPHLVFVGSPCNQPLAIHNTVCRTKMNQRCWSSGSHVRGRVLWSPAQLKVVSFAAGPIILVVKRLGPQHERIQSENLARIYATYLIRDHTR
jgi:hypothetical protein